MPPLAKKVIYLDQPAISNIAHTLPRREANKWREVFVKLDVLVRSQLVVCPDSDLHFFESVVFHSGYLSLKRLYEHLSAGLSFYDPETVERFQFALAFDEYLGDQSRTPRLRELDCRAITHGKLDGWNERFGISSNIALSEADLNTIRIDRDKLAKELAFVFRRWQCEKKSFEQYFLEEANSTGRALLNACGNYQQKLKDASGADSDMDWQALFPPVQWTLFFSLVDRCPAGINEEFDRISKVIEFLQSSLVHQIPTVKISCAIYAALAKQANCGRKNAPTRGLANDIIAISAYLPYVDAMFLDNEMRSILESGDVKNLLHYKTKIFSKSNIADFIAYLENIRGSTPPEHFEKVAQVYGENWDKPYESLLDV